MLFCVVSIFREPGTMGGPDVLIRSRHHPSVDQERNSLANHLHTQFQILQRTNSIKKRVVNFGTRLGTGEVAGTDPKTVAGLTSVMQTLLQQVRDRFWTVSDQVIGRTDEMSSRLDDLEKNIADLMTQVETEELGDENKLAATQKS
ncbi:heat shock factor-binding protein 1-like [Pteronotus mesoamericanus]|uniref:heat shock factor-binding protein 1-like n=1 Tax=Pteronotus mesoamericanus TaxID=1884717 RepID=UPI0023EC17AE|nr:heat shock factor-binding protein 1-like [Pteronotus parnellii mesoamericanus]